MLSTGGRDRSATRRRSITLFSGSKRTRSHVKVTAAGHRVVFGGTTYTAPTLLSDNVVAELERLVPFFPLHLNHNLAAIRALGQQHPRLLQVACFDNSFHRTLLPVAQWFALPRRLFEQGIRRYGFHGLSYEYIATKLPHYVPDAARVVVAHLGSGASLCAIRDGKSIESTLGFSALDGLPMGTRPGALDPGVLLYLMQALGMDAKAIEKLLYTESGLLGVSGISNDMRDLLASDDPRAAGGDRAFRLPHREADWRARRRARGARCPGFHRRHWREIAGDPKASLPTGGLARRAPGRGGQCRVAGRESAPRTARCRPGLSPPTRSG